MHFGQMVTAARKRSRLSLRELAEKVGASPSILNNIESAGHIPHDHILIRLIQVLHLSEQAVRARLIHQKTEQLNDVASREEQDHMLTAIPVIGRITKNS